MRKDKPKILSILPHNDVANPAIHIIYYFACLVDLEDEMGKAIGHSVNISYCIFFIEDRHRVFVWLLVFAFFITYST